MKIGLIKEGKVPVDRRVALSPKQCRVLQEQYPEIEITVQASDIRCFTDQEYIDEGITVSEDLSGCDVLMGIKEVPVKHLIAAKTYFFFSHTIKKQPQNRKLLQRIIKHKIRLIDYEILTDDKHNRVIGFGYFAGLVGAYNGLRAWGIKNGLFVLKPAYQCEDKEEMFEQIRAVKLNGVRIAITGNGRVASGVIALLREANVSCIDPLTYLSTDSSDVSCYVQLEPQHYVEHKEEKEFDLLHFFDYPEQYRNAFLPYVASTDLLISAAYWNPKAPELFVDTQMQAYYFKIKVIADITCDINGSIPSTIRSTSISDPFYDYNPKTKKEELPFSDDKNVTVMAVDNLPCELPKDASIEFGNSVIDKVIPALLEGEKNRMIERATITNNGKLTEDYDYLQDYVADNFRQDTQSAT